MAAGGRWWLQQGDCFLNFSLYLHAKQLLFGIAVCTSLSHRFKGDDILVRECEIRRTVEHSLALISVDARLLNRLEQRERESVEFGERRTSCVRIAVPNWCCFFVKRSDCKVNLFANSVLLKLIFKSPAAERILLNSPSRISPSGIGCTPPSSSHRVI